MTEEKKPRKRGISINEIPEPERWRYKGLSPIGVASRYDEEIKIAKVVERAKREGTYRGPEYNPDLPLECLDESL